MGSEPVSFFDSARYFLIDDKRFLLNELWSHSGSYLQTVLFSIGDSPQSALNSNVFIWLVTSITLIMYVNRVVENKVLAKYLSYLLLVIFSSNIIVGWTVGVLSESIGISFLISVIFATILNLFDQVHLSRFNYFFILVNFLALSVSKPLWAILISPLVLIFLVRKSFKFFSTLFVIFVVASGTFVVLKSADRPYDNTGLTYNGWHSLMRAYSLSLPERFGPVALGNIQKCDAVYSQVIDARNKGTPSKLYFEFPKFSESCPEIISELNYGNSNSPIKLVFNDFSATRTVFVNSIYATTQSPGNSFDKSPIGIFGNIFTSVLYPVAILLIPLTIFLHWNSKRNIFKLLFVYALGFGGSFLLYVQDGIEMERHMLPMSILLCVQSLIAILLSKPKILNL